MELSRSLSQQDIEELNSLLFGEEEAPTNSTPREEFMRKQKPGSAMVPSEALIHKVEALTAQSKQQQIRLPFKQQKVGNVGMEYPFSFKPQEVTVWAGSAGCGKSTLVGEIALSLIKQHQKVAIASYEMAPEVTLSRMIQQATRTHPLQFTPDTENRFLENYGKNLIVNCQAGWSNERAVYRLIQENYDRYGYNHFVIDNMTSCAPLSDYEQQLQFMQNLMTLAQMLNIHIHVVAHMRKKQMVNIKQEDLFDLLEADNIRGSSTVTDIACNVFTMARNTQKKRMKELGENFEDSEPDLMVRLSKQRMGTWTGFIPLWFDPKTLIFCETQARIPPARM